MRHIFLLCSALLATSVVVAQRQCHETIGGSGQDQALYAIPTSDEGYAMVGWTNSFGAGGWDLYLVKTDEGGAIEWTRTYGGPGDEADCSIEELPDGGFAIASRTNSYGSGSSDIFVVRTEVDGSVRWSRSYGGNGWEEGHSICSVANGDLIVTGYSDGFGAGGQDITLMRLDPDGVPRWSRTFGTERNERGHKVLQIPGGDLLIASETTGAGAGGWDLLLVRVTENGDVVWSKTYGLPDDDFGWDARPTTDGGSIFAGSTKSAGTGDEDILLLKLDPVGEVEWARTYGGPSTDRGFSVQQGQDGGYVVCGTTMSFGRGGQDIVLLRTDEAGDVEWCRTYGGEGSDGSQYGQPTPDGGYLVSGYTSLIGWGAWDFLLIKTDAAGNSGGCNEGRADVIVRTMVPQTAVVDLSVGYTLGAMLPIQPSVGSGGEAASCLDTGTHETEGTKEPPSYPNPTSGILRIPASSGGGVGRLLLCDGTGSTVISELLPGTGETVLDLSALAPGPYLLTVLFEGASRHERVFKY